MSKPPAVSVVVPTRDRADYLSVALASLAGQRDAPPHEIVVVDDRSTDSTATVIEAAGVRRIAPSGAGGLNAARNAGARTTNGAVVAFVDDDVWVPPEWLAALHRGAEQHPGADAFGGPIHARIEGPAPSGCGRESAPITTLDLGPEDCVAPMVWGANFAIRRSAFDRLGPFDETVSGHGDEEEWLLGLQRAGGQIAYLAAAGLDHRRVGDDSRLRSLARGAYHRGGGARRTDVRRGLAPPRARELRNVAGALWHVVRRGCPQGVIMAAHSSGRLVESLQLR